MRAPSPAKAWHLRAINSLRGGKPTAALKEARQAIAADPRDASVWNTAGAACEAMRDYDGAIAAYRRAIALSPGTALLHFSLGNALYAENRPAEAAASFERALGLDPAFQPATKNLGAVLLKQGRAEGWALWERGRLGRSAIPPGPAWQGEPLEGRTILLYERQGLGDVLQFIRFAPMLSRRGARVVVECKRALLRLGGRIEGVAEAVEVGTPLPAYDFQASLMSLPCHLAVEAVPPPYIPAPAVRRTLPPTRRPNDLKVGLVWGSDTRNSAEKCIRLALLRPLLDLPGITWFSLQKGEHVAQLGDIDGRSIVDLAPAIDDMQDTADLIAALDLVLSIDTSVAHLAGGMAWPVWVMLPFSADWRWLLDRADAPWYPTMRLFRQSRRGDWGGVVAEVAAALPTIARRD